MIKRLNKFVNIIIATGAKLLLFAVFLPIGACEHFRKVVKETTVENGVKFSISIDYIRLDDGSFNTLKDSLFILKYGDIFVYKIPYYKSISLVDNEANIISQGKDELTYALFIGRITDQTGLHFEAENIDKFGTFKVDSFLRKRSLIGLKIIDTTDFLVNISNLDNGSLEKYIPRVKADLSYADSIYIFYDIGQANAVFNIAPDIEAKKNLRINRVQFIYNPSIDRTQQMSIPRRVFDFKIDGYNDPDSTTTKKFLDKFKTLRPGT